MTLIVEVVSLAAGLATAVAPQLAELAAVAAFRFLVDLATAAAGSSDQQPVHWKTVCSGGTVSTRPGNFKVLVRLLLSTVSLHEHVCRCHCVWMNLVLFGFSYTLMNDMSIFPHMASCGLYLCNIYISLHWVGSADLIRRSVRHSSV